MRSARLESVRGVAAVAVVTAHIFGDAHHYRPEVYQGLLHRTILGGGFSLFTFFVLSGYLLYWPFAKRAFASGGAVDLRRYGLNRALRILPLYYTALVVYMILQAHGGTAGQWWRFGLFAENYFHFTFQTVDPVMWSLVVELHFYALLPIIAWGVARVARGSVARGALALGALTVASMALRYHVFFAHSQLDSLISVYSLLGLFGFLGLGMLVALGRLSVERRRPRWLSGPAARSDAWLLASLPLWLVVVWRYGDWEILSGVASMLIVAACVLPLSPGVGVRLLEWRPIAIIGVASYSLYMWHLPIVDGIAKAHWAPHTFLGLLAVAAPICIGVALLSYAVVERPFLRLRRRWASSSAPTAPEVGAAAAAQPA